MTNHRPIDRTSTKVALIYSKNTGRLRSWIVPDDDAELAAIKSNNPGEAIHIVTREQYHSALGHDHLQGFVSAHCGITPTDDRHVIVESGIVKSVVFADPPGCGDPVPPGTMLMPHPHAHVGWMLMGGLLKAPA